VIRVFKALKWLSSISGAKIMGQKLKIGKNFYTYKFPTWDGLHPYSKWSSLASRLN